MSDAEARLIDVEVMLAHHEQTLAELSEVIKRQWAEIDALKREIKRLEAIKADAADHDGPEPPPPHY